MLPELDLDPLRAASQTHVRLHEAANVHGRRAQVRGYRLQLSEQHPELTMAPGDPLPMQNSVSDGAWV